jgi:hypothetical protein
MSLLDELKRLNDYVEDGTYQAQFEFGSEAMRLDMLETADLLFEVADKIEEILTELMVRRGFGETMEDKTSDKGDTAVGE